MRRDARVPVMGLAATLMLAAPAAADAQTSLQIPLQFNFLNPGAKSMALGGAFVALADDATATFANPGGLTQIGQTEVSFEGRFTRTTTPFLQKGRLSGAVTNTGMDTIQGPFFADSHDTHFGPDYISVVYVPRGTRFVVAGYRHELARVDQEFVADGVFQQDPAEISTRRDFPQTGSRSLSVTGYGGSVAYKLRSEDQNDPKRMRVSIGGGLVVYRFNLDSVFVRYLNKDFWGPIDFSSEVGRGTQIGQDTSVAPVVGALLARTPLRIGVTYRHGASFDYVTTTTTGPLPESRFRLPHTLASGAAYQVTPDVLLAGEVTYVNYARLTKDFVTDQATPSGRQDDFGVSSTVETRFGAQYYARNLPLLPRFRAGWWFDPDHSVHYTPPGTSATVTDRLFDERLTTALGQGKDENHFTTGVGLTLLNQHCEVNAGFDLAATTTRFSLSVIVR